MNISVQYRNENNFEPFFGKMNGKTVSVLYDINTKPYALSNEIIAFIPYGNSR